MVVEPIENGALSPALVHISYEISIQYKHPQ
jgi:hypothetical protein